MIECLLPAVTRALLVPRRPSVRGRGEQNFAPIEDFSPPGR
jgi:hypothetical protein